MGEPELVYLRAGTELQQCAWPAVSWQASTPPGFTLQCRETARLPHSAQWLGVWEPRLAGRLHAQGTRWKPGLPFCKQTLE